MFDPNIPMVNALKGEASVLCLIDSSSELIGVHYVVQLHALTRWALWTVKVIYPWVSGFAICEVARSSSQAGA